MTHLNKKSISLICAMMLLSALAVYATERGNQAASSQNKIEGPAGRSGRAGDNSGDAFFDPIAEQAYQKRNAEITPWMEDNTPTNYRNAALLYYQAFLLRPEPNETIDYKLRTLSSGIEPDRQVRTYLGHCLPVIELVEIASRMPVCIWGVWPERQLSLVALRRQLGPLQDILFADARTLADDRHYRVALERCLTVRRLSRQLSEDPELYIYSTGMDGKALSLIRDILGAMPQDADILTWFRGQLVVAQGSPPSFAKKLQADIEETTIQIRNAPIASLRDMLIKIAADEEAKEKIRNLTDQQIRFEAARGFQRLMDSVFRIVDSEMTYEQKIAEIQRVTNELAEADDTDPITKQIITFNNFGEAIGRLFQSEVDHIAHINGIKAAVEVYLVVAKTGKLPEKLPDGLPKDPYSGEDFEYEVTEDGFVLRCRLKPVNEQQVRQYEFKVQKSAGLK